MFEKFKKQLSRSKEGWYETGLIWRENIIPLGNNKCGNLDRLKSLLKNLDQRQEVREAYDSVIKDQLENNIIEEVTDTEINNSFSHSQHFYHPYRNQSGLLRNSLIGFCIKRKTLKSNGFINRL